MEKLEFVLFPKLDNSKSIAYAKILLRCVFSAGLWVRVYKLGDDNYWNEMLSS